MRRRRGSEESLQVDPSLQQTSEPCESRRTSDPPEDSSQSVHDLVDAGYQSGRRMRGRHERSPETEQNRL